MTAPAVRDDTVARKGSGDQAGGYLVIRAAENEVSSMQFPAEAPVGNAEGVFDAAYDFGEGTVDVKMRGKPEQIGAAVTRYLARLSPEDVGRCGTERSTCSSNSPIGRRKP